MIVDDNSHVICDTEGYSTVIVDDNSHVISCGTDGYSTVIVDDNSHVLAKDYEIHLVDDFVYQNLIQLIFLNR